MCVVGLVESNSFRVTTACDQLTLISKVGQLPLDVTQHIPSATCHLAQPLQDHYQHRCTNRYRQSYTKVQLMSPSVHSRGQRFLRSVGLCQIASRVTMDNHQIWQIQPQHAQSYRVVNLLVILTTKSHLTCPFVAAIQKVLDISPRLSVRPTDVNKREVHYPIVCFFCIQRHRTSSRVFRLRILKRCSPAGEFVV